MTILGALSLSRGTARAFVVIGLYWGALAAYVPEIKAALGVGDAAFGTLLLATAFGLVTSIWLAPRVDRWLGARGLQVAVGLLAVAFLFPGWMTAPALFFVAMVFVGAASGLTDVIVNARVSDIEAASGQPLMNANHAMFSVGYAVAALASGLAREMGVPAGAAFMGVGAVSLMLVPGMALVPAVAEAPAVRGRYPLWPILICGAIVLIAFMSEATVESWSALHIERTLGGGAAEGAMGPAMLGLTMAVGRFSGQALTARMSEVAIIRAAAALSALGAVIAAVAGGPLVAAVGFGVLGLGVSVIGPLGLALVGQMVPAHLRTEAISRAAVMGFAGFFIAPVLMGGISELAGLRAAFLAVAGLLVLLYPLVWIVVRMRRW